MYIKGLQDEVFNDYRKPSMQIVFPYCDFKCDRENGCHLCQNSELAHAPLIYMNTDDLIKRYLANPITKAIVCGGLEPFDSIGDLVGLIVRLRDDYKCNDDIVIYTGYTEKEIKEKFLLLYNQLQVYPNLIIKFGRFIPNQEPHYDEVLGIKLASDNQYAKRIS